MNTAEQKRLEYIRNPNKIQSLRMKKGISQIEVANKLGLSRIYYGNIEKGIRTATNEIAEKIAKVYKVKTSEIFKKHDEKRFMVKS